MDCNRKRSRASCFLLVTNESPLWESRCEGDHSWFSVRISTFGLEHVPVDSRGPACP